MSNTKFDVWFFVYTFFFVIFAYTTQNLITKAVMKKKPSYLMPFGYITIIGSALIDFFIFGNSFDILTIIGLLLTSCGLFVKLIIP
jgi:drug/metabolite transporter (DMT)-like permease